MSDAATVNRLILKGASHHDRAGVFLRGEGGVWVPTPDWRADRHSIRIALALRERFGVAPGDVAALALPFGLEWVLVERAVWGLGAVTVPASAARDAAITVRSEAIGELLEYGGVLDTPERASHFRALARGTPPEVVASLEGERELTQGEWAERIGRFQARHPPERGRTHVLASDSPELAARVAVYSVWSDGLTRAAFGELDGGSDAEESVILRLGGV